MMAADSTARSFAARKITKSATRFRSRCPARLAERSQNQSRANCAASNRRECFAVRASSKLSEDSDGLLILSPEAKVGAPIGSLFPPDTILDVEITPNRGDLLSHLGLAREIAALAGQAAAIAAQIAAAGAAALKTKAFKSRALRECPFYSARRIENVKVGPSPDWLRAKLEAAGLRSINNIVDITNFVMLELGQPTARVRRRQIERRHQRPAGARRRKISRARWKDVFATSGESRHRRRATRRRNRRRHGRRRNRRHRIDQKRACWKAHTFCPRAFAGPRGL